MVLNFNLFETIELNFDCFMNRELKSKNSKRISQKKLQKVVESSSEYNISILPVQESYKFKNLYPSTNNVDKWNIFIIGSDKTYILVNINDDHIVIPNKEELINKTGQNLIPDELQKIFESIWTPTLEGIPMQILLVWNSILYLLNSYAITDEDSTIIGATMFMRRFDSLPQNMSTEVKKVQKNKNGNSNRKKNNTNRAESSSSDERSSESSDVNNNESVSGKLHKFIRKTYENKGIIVKKVSLSGD